MKPQEKICESCRYQYRKPDREFCEAGLWQIKHWGYCQKWMPKKQRRLDEVLRGIKEGIREMIK